MNSIWQVDKEDFGILKIQTILSMHIQPFELFADYVFKHATPQGQGPSQVVYFENVYSQTSFFTFVNQNVCVDAKCTCFAHAMLHLAVFISVFDWRVIDYRYIKWTVPYLARIRHYCRILTYPIVGYISYFLAFFRQFPGIFTFYNCCVLVH